MGDVHNGLGNSTIAAKANYFVNFTRSRTKTYLRVHDSFFMLQV